MERPTQATQEIKLAAAHEIVAELIKITAIGAEEKDEAAKQLASVFPWGDGYEIAKELDQRHSWDCDMEMAEVLDGYGSTVRRLIDKAQAQWVAENNIQPPLPTPSRAIYQGKTGTVTGVYEYGPAKYLFKEDGDPLADTEAQRRIIVNFEDVEAA